MTPEIILITTIAVLVVGLYAGGVVVSRRLACLETALRNAQAEAECWRSRQDSLYDSCARLQAELDRYRQAELDKRAARLDPEVTGEPRGNPLMRQFHAYVDVEDCLLVQRDPEVVRRRLAEVLADRIAKEIAKKWIPAEPKGDPSGK